MPIIWFLLKTVAFCFIYVWFRAALPRLRYDQLMDLGWKRLIPMTLAWLLLVAAIVTWHWAGLIMVAGGAGGVGAAGPGHAAGLGRQRRHESVLPSVGRRVTPADCRPPERTETGS